MDLAILVGLGPYLELSQGLTNAAINSYVE